MARENSPVPEVEANQSKHTIDMLNFFKIWFGPMSEIVKERLVSIKEQVREANISLLWAPEYLDSDSVEQIVAFANAHKINLVDISTIKPTNLIEELLLELMHLELYHWFHFKKSGNLGAASDILRLLSHCYQYGYYTDCDVTQTSLINDENRYVDIESGIVFNKQTRGFNNDIIAGDINHFLIKRYKIEVLNKYIHYIETYLSKDIENNIELGDKFKLYTLQLKLFLLSPTEKNAELLDHFKKKEFLKIISELKQHPGLFESRNRENVYNIISMSGPLLLQHLLRGIDSENLRLLEEIIFNFQKFFTCENDISWNKQASKVRHATFFTSKTDGMVSNFADLSFSECNAI